MYAYLFWQNGIQFVNGVFLGRDGAFKIKVGYVVTGIYTSVCPACSHNLNRLFKERREGILEFGLYAVCIFLYLPAAESRTVV